jgi:hypothetical protein
MARHRQGMRANFKKANKCEREPMRQGQQNRRGRGRNNNRKSQNPLMRSFESSGPDVKIRGTPSHIAEKYISLARDALSSGDPVLAENYLQHAEHYNRIILGYREQMAQGGMDPMGGGAARTHTLAGPDGSDSDEFGDDDGDDFGMQPQPIAAADSGQQSSPQQAYGHQPRNPEHQSRFDHRPPRHEQRGEQRFNNNRQDRGDGQRFDRNDRGDRQDFRGDRFERNGAGNENRFRDERRQHGNGAAEGQPGDGGFRRRDRYPGGGERELATGLQPPAAAPPQAPSGGERPAPQAQPVVDQEQPAFLRRPVRRPRREEAEALPPPPRADEE